jgi:hypothetical protein
MDEVLSGIRYLCTVDLDDHFKLQSETIYRSLRQNA